VQNKKKIASYRGILSNKHQADRTWDLRYMETAHDQPRSCYVNAVMWERLSGNHWRRTTTVLTTSTLLGAVIQLSVSHTHVLHCREREERKGVTCVVLAVLFAPVCSGVPIWDSGWHPLRAGKWVSGLNAKPRGGARRAWWAWMLSLKTTHRRPSSLGRRSSIFRTSHRRCTSLIAPPSHDLAFRGGNPR
jgi:hypothetical protein